MAHRLLHNPRGHRFSLFSDAVPVRKRDKSEEDHSIKHLRECPRCRVWVSTIVSEEHYRRQARLARYCCAGMFCAVEEYESHQTPRFSYSSFCRLLRSVLACSFHHSGAMRGRALAWHARGKGFEIPLARHYLPCDFRVLSPVKCTGWRRNCFRDEAWDGRRARASAPTSRGGGGFRGFRDLRNVFCSDFTSKPQRRTTSPDREMTACGLDRRVLGECADF